MKNRLDYEPFEKSSGTQEPQQSNYGPLPSKTTDTTCSGETHLKFDSLEQVKESISLLYSQNEALPCQSLYRISDLSVKGEQGSKSLVFQIDMSGAFYDESRNSLEAIVNVLRKKGYIVDELMQKLRDKSHLSIRLWFLVYET